MEFPKSPAAPAQFLYNSSTPKTLSERRPQVRQKLLSLVLFCLLIGSTQAPLSGQANTLAASSKGLQGFSPSVISITKDGQYAYLGFDLSEVILKVRLSDLTVVASADLSAYFPIECEQIALDYRKEALCLYTHLAETASAGYRYHAGHPHHRSL
jgi:hypothetical protein